MHLPPEKVGPGKLFRLLLRSPRPWLDLDYRIPSLPQFALRVVALSARDVLEAFDSGTVETHIVAAALHLRDGRRAFETVEQVGMMLEREASTLAGAVTEALGIISPVIPISDSKALMATLRKGADENPSEALALGSCYDAAFGFGVGRIIPRPDRFYGLPFRQLTDGQWLLYHACREWVEKHSDRKGARTPVRAPRRRRRR